MYLDSFGKDHKWDRAVRTTKISDDTADAVAIFATVRRGGEDYIIAVKQFRPPINVFTLELPAGLIEVGETAGEAAKREMLEETNYGGYVTGVSDEVYLSPGLTNESVKVVRMELEEGKGGGVKDSSEEGRGLGVVLLRKNCLMEDIGVLQKGGVKCFGMLYTLAMGMEIMK